MSIALRHPVTGEIRVQPEGWSWSCFLGAGMFGLPLFKRGLPVCGAAMLVLDVAVLVAGWTPTANADALYLWMSAIVLGASVLFGFKANGMAIDHALLRGWEYADPSQGRFG